MGGIIVGQEAAAARSTGDDAVTALREAIGVLSSVCDDANLTTRKDSTPPTPGSAMSWPRCPRRCGPMTRPWPRGTCCASTAASSTPPGSATTTCPAQPAPTNWKPNDASKPASAPASTPSTGASSNTARHTPTCAATQTAATSPWPSPTTRTWLPRPDDPRPPLRRRGQGQRVPLPSLPAVIELADAHQIEVTAEVRALAKIFTERAGHPPPCHQSAWTTGTRRSSSTPRSTTT